MMMKLKLEATEDMQLFLVSVSTSISSSIIFHVMCLNATKNELLKIKYKVWHYKIIILL